MLEAQAYGCVPIAYDSYASLKDTVSDEETGIIVENFGDTENFSAKLSRLMKNANLRESLAENGKRNAGKFSSEKIAEAWTATTDELFDRQPLNQKTES